MPRLLSLDLSRSIEKKILCSVCTNFNEQTCESVNEMIIEPKGIVMSLNGGEKNRKVMP